jgi:NTE family protein
MYKAVEIGGEAYWDGGFSANPALFPLVANRASPDILIVQINPVHRPALPRSARDIINRVNEISFNTSLIKELRALALAKRVAARLGPEAEAAGVDLVHLHLVHVDEEVQDLAASSKMNAEWGYLSELFDRGRRWADLWLRDNFASIGRASTFDVEQLFAAPAPRPAELPPTLEP